MKIVLAFDSFKGSLSAEHACRAAARALSATVPTATLVEKPMADGGEGTAAAMLAACGGNWIPLPASGPVPELMVDAGYAQLADGSAVVEMAAVNGLTLLRPDRRNPMIASTLGTGEVLKAALEGGAEHIYLALGGSATVDGGIGAAHALGWRFLDERDRELTPDGAALLQIATIRPPEKDLCATRRITVLCDVTNPLCGSKGAARVFGPQKGATPDMVAVLDAGLDNLARRVREQLGFDMLAVKGGGAAGGLAAGAAAFFHAEIQPGIDTIMRLTGLPGALSDADWVFTGEGSFDAQSLDGKVVSGVARVAAEMGARVAVFAGRVGLEPEIYRAAGIQFAMAITPPSISIDEAARQAPSLLYQAVAQFSKENF